MKLPKEFHVEVSDDGKNVTLTIPVAFAVECLEQGANEYYRVSGKYMDEKGYTNEARIFAQAAKWLLEIKDHVRLDVLRKERNTKV